MSVFPHLPPAVAALAILLILAACGKVEDDKKRKPSFAPRHPTMQPADDETMKELREQLDMVQRKLDRAEDKLPKK